MNTNRYLIIGYNPKEKQSPSVRVAVNKPSLSAEEVAVKLNITLPDELFLKPHLSATINVDECLPDTIDAEVVADIQKTIKERSNLDLKIEVATPEI